MRLAVLSCGVYALVVCPKGFGMSEILTAPLHITHKRTHGLMMHEHVFHEIAFLGEDFVAAKDITQEVRSVRVVGHQVALQVMPNFEAFATLLTDNSMLHSVFAEL